MTAKKHKEKRYQTAIDEKKRLTVQMQAKARDKRAIHRGRQPKEKQISGDSSPRILRMNEMVELDQMRKKQREDFREKYGHTDAAKLDRSFVEKTFGSAKVESEFEDSLTSNIVSLALVDDNNEVLFACSGIAMKHTAMTDQEATIIVTSKRLVAEFNGMRNRDDDLRIKVLFPDKNNRHIKGFLGLYDKDIAVVTCFCYSNPCAVDIDTSVRQQSDPDSLEALGRLFSSGTLRSVKGQQIYVPTTDASERALIYSDCAITEAGLGGPVTNMNGHFLGLIVDWDTKVTSILPWKLLHERFQYFEKYTPNSTNYREYTLPEDLWRVVPSGHWNTVKFLTSMGYPEPPPLVLEIGGTLRNKFEEDFGDLYGYGGLNYNLWCRGTDELVFSKLPTKVVTKLCRRVVLLTSYDGDTRYFSCTGYLIKWHKKGTPVILTSASLIRSSDNENMIDENLKIDVFLPPNQHATGTLELYHLDYNIAVISVQTRLHGIHPEDIFHTKKGRKKVVAVGREVKDGVLMGTIGKVTKMPNGIPSKLDCKDLKLSTCKIKKVGIGGPLVNFIDGSYTGMNFYDGTSKTPYLPRRIIAKVLCETDLPSQIEMNQPTSITNGSLVNNRWPVPKPYWYHPKFVV